MSIKNRRKETLQFLQLSCKVNPHSYFNHTIYNSTLNLYLCHMNNKQIENILSGNGIHPTAVRVVVWNAIADKHEPFTLKDAEQWLPYTDRSSIFRTLKLFADQHLLHELDDGSGIRKYCLCRCESKQHIGHVHFTCTSCGKTFCLDNCHIPSVILPKGYTQHEAEYLIKGICSNCQ